MKESKRTTGLRSPPVHRDARCPQAWPLQHALRILKGKPRAGSPAVVTGRHTEGYDSRRFPQQTGSPGRGTPGCSTHHVPQRQVHCRHSLRKIPMQKPVIWVHLPVTLFITKVISYLVHDGSSGKNVGFVFLLGIIFNYHYEPVHRAMSFQHVLPLGKVVFYRSFIHFSILKISKSVERKVDQCPSV